MRVRGAICLLLTLACAQVRPVARPAPGERPIAVLPLANLSRATAPLRALQAAVEAELRGRGIALVPHEKVEEFLARHRIRYTGGVDAESARAAGEELGAGGLLVTLLEEYEPGTPPREAISMRLVAADESARLRFVDQVARSGDDAPGLFELGVVREPELLQQEVIGALGASLASYLAASAAHPAPCPKRFAPRELFRGKALELPRSASVAVLPFENQTDRRFAGELVALEFVRELEASGRFSVVEPGVLRDDLLQFRIVAEGGLSLDQARVVLDLVHADYVLAGTVREYLQSGANEAPRVEFTASLLDRKNNEVVWESSSWSRGDDGVFFFDLGRVGTVESLSCAMVRSTVDALLTPRK